jgi:hypothetical protein
LLLGVYGHSRDGKSRNRQVLVGVVMVDGWPITHHVFRGNTRDAKTVKQVLEDLEQRFGLRCVVFVGDRGMVTSDNVALLRFYKQGYVVGLNRCWRENVYCCIERATGPWTECFLGIAAREMANLFRTYVQEVVFDEPGVRIFVAKSEERASYESSQRLKAMERVRISSSAPAPRRAGQAESTRQDRCRHNPHPRPLPRLPLLRLKAKKQPLPLLRASREPEARANL